MFFRKGFQISFVRDSLHIVFTAKLFAIFCAFMALSLSVGCSDLQFSREKNEPEAPAAEEANGNQNEQSSQEVPPGTPTEKNVEKNSEQAPEQAPENGDRPSASLPASDPSPSQGRGLDNSKGTAANPNPADPLTENREAVESKLPKNFNIELISKDRFSDVVKLHWDCIAESVLVVRRIGNQEITLGEARSLSESRLLGEIKLLSEAKMLGEAKPLGEAGSLSSKVCEFFDLDPVYLEEVEYFLKSRDDKRISEILKIQIPPLKFFDGPVFQVDVLETRWNQYQVYIKWTLPFTGTFELHKKDQRISLDAEKNTTSLQKELPRVGGYMDTQVVSGKNYEYEIFYIGNKRFEQKLPFKQSIVLPNRVIDFRENKFEIRKVGYNDVEIDWEFNKTENIKLVRRIDAPVQSGQSEAGSESVLANQILLKDHFFDRGLPFGREISYYFVQTDSSGNEVQRSAFKKIRFQQPQISELKDNFKVEVSGHPRPHEYQISVNWALPFEIRLRGYLTKRGFSKSLVFDSLQHGFRYEKAMGGEIYTVTIEDDVGGVVSFEEQIPRDYVLSEAVSMKEFVKIQANRLFVLPEGNLFTNGNDLSVEVKELIGQGGVIGGFSPTDIRWPFRAARSGGLISIRAERAFGNIKLRLDGEAGEMGASGAPWGEDGRGTPGSAGVHGEGRTRTRCGRSPEGGRDCLDFPTCDKLASSGGDGGPGALGRRGGAGGVGGNTTHLDVVIGDGKKLEIEISKDPGIGGTGGPGGPGGPGGFGGAAGRVASECEQSDIRNGNPGPEGGSGEVGPQGPSGKVMPICISLSKEEKQKCDDTN